MKYLPCYKCPLCGTLVSVGASIEISYDNLPEYTGKHYAAMKQFGHRSQDFGVAPMEIPHKCKDGSCGIAVFAGMKLVKEDSNHGS